MIGFASLQETDLGVIDPGEIAARFIFPPRQLFQRLLAHCLLNLPSGAPKIEYLNQRKLIELATTWTVPREMKVGPNCKSGRGHLLASYSANCIGRGRTVVQDGTFEEFSET